MHVDLAGETACVCIRSDVADESTILESKSLDGVIGCTDETSCVCSALDGCINGNVFKCYLCCANNLSCYEAAFGCELGATLEGNVGDISTSELVEYRSALSTVKSNGVAITVERACKVDSSVVCGKYDVVCENVRSACLHCYEIISVRNGRIGQLVDVCHEVSALDRNSSLAIRVTASVVSTECYVEAFRKLNGSRLVAAYVCPCAVLCNVLYVNVKSVVDNSPCAVAVFNANGNLCMIAELVVEVTGPRIIEYLNVRSSLVADRVVAVVSECATNEVMLVVLSCEYNTCVTAGSVELSLELIYIEGVCCNSILSLCNVTEVVILCTVGLIVSRGCQRVTSSLNGINFIKLISAYCTVVQRLVNKVREIYILGCCISKKLALIKILEVVKNSVCDSNGSLRIALTASVVRTERYRVTFGKLNRRRLVAAYVCPCAVLSNVLYVNSKSVVNNSPGTVTVFNENGNFSMVAELFIEVTVPLILKHLNVRSLGAFLRPVSVVSECATNEVMLVVLSCNYNACVTARSVESSLELIYIVGVCCNSILRLCNVTEVV